MFSAENVPGALYRCLEPFAVRGIDLTKIESRPLRGRRWEYLSYSDFLGSTQEALEGKASEEDHPSPDPGELPPRGPLSPHSHSMVAGGLLVIS